MNTIERRTLRWSWLCRHWEKRFCKIACIGGEKMRRVIGICLALVCFGVFAAAQGESKRGPSTPEERQRFVAIAHKMEQSPLDEDLRSERKWGLFWLAEVPDFTVHLCTGPLGDFMSKKYKYSPEIVIQLTFSAGAFLIEHPEKKDDRVAEYVAGVEGALNAYKSILKAKPEAKSKELDDLLKKQSQGTLLDFVRESSSKACKVRVDGQ